ncbi:hypothetical protein PCANC_02250 [Puccinia coronata f. sp. avenae]|uniref:Uncharacterized protein n=1 Tax=Puccinia coronata f. sp. avenae TaxID=200324 RepID=A0A2N5TM77_9BASI|nr:hypothetical protein PCASD_20886 [Puccinia coronata f. sp. avenae]PLW55825.1 hypothetical protein PCANC_02250 [Puccinia coronata f. sp. avenae]
MDSGAGAEHGSRTEIGALNHGAQMVDVGRERTCVGFGLDSGRRDQQSWKHTKAEFSNFSPGDLRYR